MGSYDTGESMSLPSFTGGRARVPQRSTPDPNLEENVNESQESSYDSNLKTIVTLGGGLTPDRIAYVLPEEVREGTLQASIDYLMSPEVAVRSEDRSIAEAVEQRMGQNGWRVIINDSLNLGSEAMTQPLSQYLVKKESQTEDGQLEYNTSDLAIVSHDEGGF